MSAPPSPTTFAGDLPALEHVAEAFLHGAHDRARRDAVLLVIGELLFAPRLADGDELLDRIGHLVGVENDEAVEMARGAARGLDERRLRAEKALLVGVEHGDERDLGQVEPLAQKIDADEHIDLAGAQAAQDFHPLDRVDFGVDVAHLDAEIAQVIGEVLGGALGQRGDEHALAHADAQPRLLDQIVDLPGRAA